MIKFLQILIFISIIHAAAAEACSFAKYQMFPPENPLSKPKGAIPDEPNVIYKIKRGYSDEYDSCADTGVIILSIEPSQYSQRSVGYFVEVLENSTGQDLFPSYAIYGNEKDGSEFVFPWLDGASDVQEPLRIVINVYRVSTNWARSKPVKIAIENHGNI